MVSVSVTISVVMTGVGDGVSDGVGEAGSGDGVDAAAIDGEASGVVDTSTVSSVAHPDKAVTDASTAIVAGRHTACTSDSILWLIIPRLPSDFAAVAAPLLAVNFIVNRLVGQ
jgi:hypothetical protein